MDMSTNKPKKEVVQPNPTRKAINTYQAEMRKPTYKTDSPLDWTNLKISASEYVQYNYPRVESDDPKVTHHSLYHKFNTNGLNDQRIVRPYHRMGHRNYPNLCSNEPGT